MAKKTIILEVDSGKSITNIAQLEAEIEKLDNQLKSAEFGSKEFDELNQKAIKAKSSLKNLELQMEALDGEQVSTELGSVVTGLVDTGTAAIAMSTAFGVSQESADELTATLVSGMAISNGIKSGIDGIISARKLMNQAEFKSIVLKTKSIAVMVAQKAAMIAGTVATKSITIAQNAWNFAMSANPIGLIIIGIAGLIAGITAAVTHIEDIVNWFTEMGKKLLWLSAGPLAWLIGGLSGLGDAEEESSKKTESAEEKRRKAKEASAAVIQQALISQIAALDKLQAKNDEINKKEDEIFQLKKARMEAEGKDTKALEEAHIKSQIKRLEAIKETTTKAIAIKIAEFKQNAKLQGMTDKEIADKLAEQSDLYNDLAEKLNGINNEIYSLNTELISLNKRTKSATKSTHKLGKSAEGSAGKFKKLNDAIKEVETSLDKVTSIGSSKIAIKTPIEIIPVDEDELEEEIIQTTGKITKFMEANVAAQQEDGGFNLNKFFAVLLGVDEKTISGAIEIATQTITKINDIVQAKKEADREAELKSIEQQADKENEILQTKLTKGELTKREFDAKSIRLEQQKKQKLRRLAQQQFQKDKRNDIVQAGIDGSKAALAGIATYGPPPSPLGIASLIAAASITTAQISQISSKQFTASSGGIVPGSPSNIDSVPSLLAPGEIVINSNSSAAFAPLLNSINQLGGGKDLGVGVANLAPQKVYVVESDITDTQQDMNRLKNITEF